MLLFLTGCLLNVSLYEERRAELCDDCGASQTGEEDAWPDCDGDGFGSDVAPTSINFQEPVETECDWVRNALDCDDAYAQSGARLGSACPEEFSLTYEVRPFEGREFLVVDGPLADPIQAEVWCEAWGGHLAPLESDVARTAVSTLVHERTGLFVGWTGRTWTTDAGWAPSGDYCGVEPDPALFFPFLEPEAFEALAPDLRLQWVVIEGEACFDLQGPWELSAFICER